MGAEGHLDDPVAGAFPAFTGQQAFRETCLHCPKAEPAASPPFQR